MALRGDSSTPAKGWASTISIDEDNFIARIAYTGTISEQKKEETLFFIHPESGVVLDFSQLRPGQGVLLECSEAYNIMLEAPNSALFNLIGFKVSKRTNVTFRIIDKHNNMIAEYTKRPMVQLSSVIVRDERNIGVYEPGKEFIVTQVNLENMSGVPLPEGTILHLSGSEFALPEILPGASVFDVDFSCKVNVSSGTPSDVAFEKEIICEPYITCYGRKFSGTKQIHFPLNITHPIRVESLECGMNMQMNTEYPLEFDLVNLATVNFYEGEVSLKFSCVSKAVELSLNGTTVSDSIPLNVPNSGTSHVMGTLKLTKTAQTMMTETCEVFVHIVFDGHIVQTFRRAFRVVPAYDNKQSDVLLVSSGAFSSSDLAFWDDRFRSLGLTYSIWDIEFYGGMRSSMKAPWLNRCKIVVFPYFSWCVNRGLLVEVPDFIIHFGKATRDVSGIRDIFNDFKPAFLCFDSSPDDLGWLAFDYSAPCLIRQGSGFTKFNMRRREVSDPIILKKADKLTKETIAQGNESGYVFRSRVFKDLQKRGWRVNLGIVELYRSSIAQDSQLLTIAKSVDAGTDCFNATLALLYVIPIEKRLTMMFARESNFGNEKLAGSISRLFYWSFVDSLSHDRSIQYRIVNYISSVFTIADMSLALPLIAAVRASMNALSSSDHVATNLANGIFGSLSAALPFTVKQMDAFIRDVSAHPGSGPVRPLDVFALNQKACISDHTTKRTILKHSKSVATSPTGSFDLPALDIPSQDFSSNDVGTPSAVNSPSPNSSGKRLDVSGKDVHEIVAVDQNVGNELNVGNSVNPV